MFTANSLHKYTTDITISTAIISFDFCNVSHFTAASQGQTVHPNE